MTAMIHDYLGRRLLGADALAIESHWRFLYERMANIGVRGTELRAISAIDLALWDILGQVCKQPVYRLLGGPVRDSVPVYNSCGNPSYGFQSDPATQSRKGWQGWPGMGSIGRPGPVSDSYSYFHRPVELAKELIELGYTAMKVWPLDFPAIMHGPMRISHADIRQALGPLEKIREAVGDGTLRWRSIATPIINSPHPAALRIARALRPLNPALWLEDIVKLDNIDTLADFRRQGHACRSPPARCCSAAPDYAAVFEKRAADYIMIDPTWIGGISETIRVGRSAQAYNLPRQHARRDRAADHAGGGPRAGGPSQRVVPGNDAGPDSTHLQRLDRSRREDRGRKHPLVTGPGLGARLNPDLFKPIAIGYRKSVL